MWMGIGKLFCVFDKRIVYLSYAQSVHIVFHNISTFCPHPERILNRIDLFLYYINGVAEAFVLLDLSLYLFDTVVDGGVILSSKDDTHHFQGGGCHVPAQIHEYLAGNRDLSGPLAALKICDADSEMLGDRKSVV